MNSSKILKNVLYLILFCGLSLTFINCAQPPRHNEINKCFEVLDKIKTAKKKQIIRYFDTIKQIAHGANEDKNVLQCFHAMREYYTSKPGMTNTSTLYRLEYEMDAHFVNKYGDFYDVLFVDNEGFVFHSIKHEADYHTNLFTGTFSDTELAKHMKNNPDNEFVDYEFYPPSEEPAAFFVIPVREHSKNYGWLVLQFPIDKINAILSEHKGLGRTGEVYLVNRNKLMLTDSRFIEDSTILKQKVDTEAIKLALTTKSDKRVINDYRGVKVFSSFEQFDIFGHEWIIVVEIDEDEIISDHYQLYKKYYLPKITEHYSNVAPSIYSSQKGGKKIIKGKRVDMNEFCMAKSGEVLETKGVGPCTSLVIYYPEKFGYLTHISPTDEIYQDSLVARYLFSLWGRKTNFLEKILERIQYYDIYPYQLRDLQFIVVAPHSKSLGAIIDQLYDRGINLTQIKFLFNPSADYANVAFDQSDDSIYVEWLTENRQVGSIFEKASNIESIGSLVKRMTGYSSPDVRL